MQVPTRTFVAVLSALLIAGCAPDAPPPSTGAITTANSAINAGQSDQAITATQSYLRANPHGPAAAEAWYLQGRGFEQKAAMNQLSGSQVRSTLHEARSCYLQALGQSPANDLEADIHVALSNVAYYQDDFPTAIEQAAIGMNMTQSNQVKGLLLYRTGVCQQRLARFSDADQTYRQVEQRFPGTVMAESARRCEGLRLFYVQLATFADAAAADRALLAGQNYGYVLNRVNDRGKYVLSAGPFSTYEDARRAKEKFEDKFTTAIIVP